MDSDENGVSFFSEKESIKKQMLGHKGDFDTDLFSNLLTRKDISHLFLSDIQVLTQKL
jgi:hypothetical protein